jgi:hypothetical protein
MAKDKKRRDKASAPSAPDAAASPNPIESVVGAVSDAVGAVAGAVAGAVERAAETVAHAADSATGGHGAARAHGQPATVDESLPATREELIARHAEARRRRAAASLGSEAYRAAADEIGRIEVRIAAIERDQVPPRV